MSNEVATMTGASLEQVLIGGDLSKLSPTDRVMYYKAVCESVGLNPLTKPFEYISLNNKLTLYAKRDCTDQLRKINGVSILIISREVVEDCYVVTARGTDKHGRHDESIGAVPIGTLKGEARSNAMMKAETKAKRRVTLSICGLGILDESEADSIPGAYPKPSTGVEEQLTREETMRVDEVVSNMKEWITQGSIGDAVYEMDNAALNAEQTIYLWTHFDSKQRAAMKREQSAAKAKRALPPPANAHTPAKPATPAPFNVADLITDAQRKRLEARIGELKLDREAVKKYVFEHTGKEHFTDLTKDEYAQLDAVLDKKAVTQAAKQVKEFAADYDAARSDV